MRKQGQVSEKTVPSSHSEPLVWPGWDLLGISMVEGGHCLQITLGVGKEGTAICAVIH